jgi:hypothetical protein
MRIIDLYLAIALAERKRATPLRIQMSTDEISWDCPTGIEPNVFLRTFWKVVTVCR